MKKRTFEVRYFYLASGMEGNPDVRTYLVEAESGQDAIEKQILKEYPEDVFYGPENSFSSRSFLRGCLSAKEVRCGETPPMSTNIRLSKKNLDKGKIVKQNGVRYRVYKCGFTVLLDKMVVDGYETEKINIQDGHCPDYFWDECFEKDILEQQ